MEEKMTGPDANYLAKNRRIAERLLILLEDRRLLRERVRPEGRRECMMSAQTLRKVLENEMLTVSDKGFLLQDLRDLRTACTNFVSMAGPDATAFEDDEALFFHALTTLRAVFAQRLSRIIESFDLEVSEEIRDITSFKA
jgi:hypothetical protein